MTQLQTKPMNGASDPWTAKYVPHGESDPISLTPKIIRDLIAIPTKQGHYPSDQEIKKFLLLCKSMKLNPFVRDAFLVGYDSNDGPSFSLITAHQAFLKRAELHPEYDGMESGVIVEREGEIVEEVGDFLLSGDTVLGGWARVHFKNRRHAMYKRVRLETYNTGRSRWKADPVGMIVKVAEADALRSSFPTMLGGLYGEGETVHEIRGDVDASPAIGQNRVADVTRAIEESSPATELPKPYASEESHPSAKEPTKENVPAMEPPKQSSAGIRQTEVLDSYTVLPAHIVADLTAMIRELKKDGRAIVKSAGVKTLDRLPLPMAMKLIEEFRPEWEKLYPPSDASE